jgi:hypothetical protein
MPTQSSSSPSEGVIRRARVCATVRADQLPQRFWLYPLCGNKARHPADPSPYRGFVFQTRAKARDYIRGILLFKASFDLLEQKPQRPLPLRDEEHLERHAEMKLGRVRRGCDQNTEGAVE